MAEAMVRLRRRRAIVFSQLQPGMPIRRTHLFERWLSEQHCVTLQYERFKRQEEQDHSFATKCWRNFPVCAACIGLRNRGASTYNESEVLNRESSVKHADEVDDIRELDHDIDFTITIGSKKVLCRAASAEEKKRWLVALNGATTVRSFT
jgi:hypothetical protein